MKKNRTLTNIILILFLLPIFVYGQNKGKIKRQYSCHFHDENFVAVCEFVTKIFPSFVYDPNKNNTFRTNKEGEGYLFISIKQKGKIKVCLNANDRSNENIEKFRDVVHGINSILQ